MKPSIKPWIAVSALLVVTGTVLIGKAIFHRMLAGLPPVESLEQYVPPLASTVLDASGQAVGEFFVERRTAVPLTQIPVDLRNAIIATEDAEFFHHWGVDLSGISRAMLANLRARRVVQGGSTLTQQLAKTIFLTRARTYIRKLNELLLTMQIENRYSKDEILELYLNQVYFGVGAYGVEAAANFYFDKRTSELNLPECALLAGLVRSPNRYAPTRNPDIARGRRSMVLGRMRAMGFITAAEEAEANEHPVSAEPGRGRTREALYFLEEIRKSLEPRLGAVQLEQGGLTIQSTLNLEMQQAAERIMEEHLAAYDVRYATATLEEFNRTLTEGTTMPVEISTTPPHIQGALVALDVHTGAIRAMVGGRNFSTSQFNRAMQAQRQPGSAFKPFVWAAALERGFTAATRVDDLPLAYIDMESEPTLLGEATSYAELKRLMIAHLEMDPAAFWALGEEEQREALRPFWRPQNYDGRYMGPVTLRTALQRSRNIVSVRLNDNVGARRVARLARQAGIKSRMPSVLSLALGTAVTNLLELTAAFGTLASGGLHAEPYFIERVVDQRGRALTETSPKVEARLDPVTAFLTTHLLQGVVQRGTGWYARRLNRPLGAKTGTTQDQRDLLFVGFSADLACGVWIGYDDFRPLKRGLTASHIAVPLWTDFMREALKSYPARDFPVPQGIEFVKVDGDTGYLSLPSCPNVILEAFRRGTAPTVFCPVQHPFATEEEEPVSE